MEAALGKQIEGTVRARLVELTDNFLSFAPFEMTAEPIDGAEERLANIRKAANKLQQVLIERGPSDAGVFADHLIGRHFHDARVGKKDKIHTVTGILTSLIVSCRLAQTEIDQGEFGEHKRGEAWDTWIRNLTKLLRENDLPTQVRKDTDKNSSGVASPFVRFIDKLQNCFEGSYRRGIQSPPALAEAITRARRVRNGLN